MMFEIRDELYNYVYSPGTATLEAIGSCATGFAYTTFSGVPVGTYPYTIEAEGYEPYKGLVVVNEASADWRSNTVHMVVFLREKARSTTGIDAPVATADGMFRLFPTIATDVLHILPGTAADGEWTVRITSSQGMAMYAARHVLDVETVLPVGNLAPGLYLLTLDNGMETVTYKFVKR